MPRYLLIALLLALPCIVWGSGGSKSAPLLVTVHIETDASEGPQFTFPLPIPGTNESRVFKKSADITDREIEWFYLFPAENGNGHGAAFKFTSVGTSRLEYLSSANQGRYLLTAVHPGSSSFVRIDKVISDGIVVVWDGLVDSHIALLREHLAERTPSARPEEPTLLPAPVGSEKSSDAPPAAPEKKKRFNPFRK